MCTTDDGEGAGERRRRSRTAAGAVTAGFGHRLMGLPGTFIGSVRRTGPRWGSFGGPPGPRWSLFEPWHYWWQAHFLDCLIDAAWREYDSERFAASRGGEPNRGIAAAVPWHRLAVRLLRTIKLRNGNRWVNSFYDDMAWLALATGRLDVLTKALKEAKNGAGLGRHIGLIRHTGTSALTSIIPQLESAATTDLGGGLFWSTKRDFKNTPATAPAALAFARNEWRTRAQQLIDWLNEHLLDPESGLYLDGIRSSGAGPVVERVLYSYNQGPVLGTLIELGGEANLGRAEELIAAVEHHFLQAAKPGPVLRTHGGGDGGLFTGILVRYLALAANCSDLSDATRHTAAAMVHNTAEAMWVGREHRAEEVVFSSDPAHTAAETYPVGTAVELSTQLQAWMILEAAAAVH